MSTLQSLFVIVNSDTGTPVPPIDCNPDHEDQGMMVYLSREAADLAAIHQSQFFFGDDPLPIAIPLADFLKDKQFHCLSCGGIVTFDGTPPAR